MSFTTRLIVRYVTPPYPISRIGHPWSGSAELTTWHLYTTVDADGAFDHQVPQEIKTAALSLCDHTTSSGNTVFSRDLSIYQANRGDFVALTCRLPGDDGYLFRSGKLDALPTTDALRLPAVEVLHGTVAIDRQRIDSAAQNYNGLALTGLPPGFSGKVTSVSVQLGDGKIALKLGGEVSPPPPPPLLPPLPTVSFTYTATLTLVPADDLFDTKRQVDANIGDSSISFSGGSLASKVVAALLTCLGGLVAGSMTDAITAAADQTIDAAIRSAVHGLMPSVSGMSQPTISLQRISITPAAISGVASYGAFVPVWALVAQPLHPPAPAPVP